jgi:hypothetical protein
VLLDLNLDGATGLEIWKAAIPAGPHYEQTGEIEARGNVRLKLGSN